MDDEIYLHIGRRLMKRRKLMGLTQARLGAEVGASHQAIQQYECGATRVTAERLWRIGQALGVAVDYFYDGITAPGVNLETH